MASTLPVSIVDMNKRLPDELFYLIIILCVFGLTFLMVAKQYEAAVITAVVTATSLAAAELIRRYRETTARGRDDERN